MVKLAEKSKSIYDIAHNLICGKLRKTGKTQTPDVAIEELVQLTGVTKELATDAVENGVKKANHNFAYKRMR
jgi:hypothetical protein